MLQVLQKINTAVVDVVDNVAAEDGGADTADINSLSAHLADCLTPTLLLLLVMALWTSLLLLLLMLGYCCHYP